MNDFPHPSYGALLDYWLSDTPHASDEEIEEHVFGCAECTEKLETVQKTGASIVVLTRQGELRLSATGALQNRMARDGVNVREYVLRSGQTVACTVTPHDDFVLARLVVQTQGRARIDLSLRAPDGTELGRVDDIAYDPEAGEVLTCMPARLSQGDPCHRMQLVLSTRSAQGERVLGHYTLDHTAMNEA